MESNLADAEPLGGPMVLEVPGASPEELSAGIAAAQAFLDAHQLTPMDAAIAMGELETWDDGGIDEESALPEGPSRIADLWGQAQTIAIETAWANRAGEPPQGSRLSPFADYP